MGGIQRIFGILHGLSWSDFRGATILGDATGKDSLDDGGHWAAIIVGEPEEGFQNVRRKGRFIENAQDDFCIKIWFRCVFNYDTNGFLLAERNFDDLADF